MFKAGGCILRGINGNVSFTVIIFFYLNILYFFITPRTLLNGIWTSMSTVSYGSSSLNIKYSTRLCPNSYI